MTNFEDLKSQWENQPNPETPNDGYKDIIKKVNFIKNKQLITNIVLGLTTLVLTSFFFYIKAYKNGIVSFSLLLMIAALLTRILIENLSTKRLKNINVTLETVAFKQKMIDYYKKRIKTHYVITPIIVVLYIVGFVMLLPFFKQELSNGFYTYIKVSAVVIFVVLTVFIRKQILKEIKILQELSQ